MAINTNFPNVRPSLLLDFANAQQLDSRVTFSRSTTAPYYDGKTSVLAEQNLFLTSEQFDNTNWGKTATTVTANSTVAPDGTTTADTVTADGTTGVKLISASNMGAGAAPATARTVSVYAKAGTNNFLQIYFSGDGTPWADFDLSAGTIGSTGSNQTASIVALPNSWYRCILYTASTTATTVNLAIVSSSSATRGESNSLSTSVILWGAQLEQRSSVTAYNATTTSAITNYIPQLLTAPINSPRFDFNPTTGESLGLLIEQSSTNLLTYSQDFSNGAWTKTNSTITTGAGIALDGTQTFNLLQETSATGLHAISETYTKAASAITYTQQVIFKAKERTYSYIQVSDGAGNGAIVYFNLSTGAISTAVAGVGTAFTSLSATITAQGNNTYKCTLTSTSNTATSFVAQFGSSTDGSTNSYAGNGYSGIYIWGAQLEALAFPTSYIATTSAQVTRASDNASMTGTNFSSWYNSQQGTLYCEMTAPQVSGVTGTLFEVSTAATSNNRVTMRGWTSNFAVVYQTSIATQQDLSVPNRTNGAYFKSTISYGSISDIACVNGTLSGNSYTAMSVPATQLVLGNGSDGTANNGFWFKKFAFYPNRVTNAQMQSLTGS